MAKKKGSSAKRRGNSKKSKKKGKPADDELKAKDFKDIDKEIE